MAWTTPGTATAGEVLTAAFWNANVRDNLVAISRGLLAYASTTTQTGLSTTVADIAGLSVTWTAVASQNYLVVASVSGTLKQTNAGFVQYQLTDASNNQQDQIYEELALNATLGKGLMFNFIRNAAAGSTTRKVRQQTGSAGGVFNRGDTGDNKGTFIAVIDIGNTSV